MRTSGLVYSLLSPGTSDNSSQISSDTRKVICYNESIKYKWLERAEEDLMKWQGFEKSAEKANKFVISVRHSRSILVIAAVTALIIVAAATAKWGG